ncbi:MAG: hypothetical protein R3253_13225, partial [Longimicrobiales bacterium]|nr:hypothetical protein [Longimicrobiales bacterium]
ALDEAWEKARGLPSTMPGTWDADALERDPEDGLGRAGRKLVARIFSPARKAGSDRSVPVRAVALTHLHDRLAPAVDQRAVEVTEAWAAWERRLELAWIEWGDGALPALIRSELPEEKGPAVEGDDEEKQEESEASPWAQIGQAGKAFQASLLELRNECPVEETRDALSTVLDQADERLQDDLAVAGSLVFDPENTHRLEPSLPKLTELAPVMETWEEGVESRLHLYEALLAIIAGGSAVQRRLVYRVREEHLAGTSVLKEVAVRLEELARELPRDAESRDALVQHLQALEARVKETLEPTEQAVPGTSEVERSVEKRANAAVDALLSMVRQAPASLELHPEQGRLPRGGRKPEVRSLAMQELARQSFDALRIERIRSSTTPLVGAIAEVRADVEELPNVFAFAFAAAKQELEEGQEGARERARGLVEEALLSMAESLRNADRSLAAAVLKARVRLAREVSEGSLALVDRVAAGRMQARILAARSWFADAQAWIVDRWGPPLRRAGRAVALRWNRLRRLASRGLKKGTAIVGTGPVSEAASARTLRTLSAANEIVKDLPLVYQRLFTLRPLDEPSLLAGRDKELEEGLGRWRRWRSDDGVPLIVRGRPGSGITSFLNVLGTRITEDEAAFGRISLPERIDDEGALAALVANELGLDAASSLDALARAVFDAPKGGLPDAMVVDNLEHIYLRVPGGTDLIERLLTFMAETEPRTFWIGGITSSAWQLISATEPTAVSQVDTLELGALSEQEIREAIMLRHRRSGLPLRFQEPDAKRRMLRQRLKRMRDREGYEDLVENDFFDQLEKASSRNLRLALFQWLMAADFGQAEGVLMRSPDRPDFTVLDTLTLTQNFTLKAFLEHRSLSLAEHDRIFRLPRHESYQIFESLQNRQLIESVVADDDPTPTRSEIEEDRRYRVRPLLVGAIISHLRGRNIFH